MSKKITIEIDDRYADIFCGTFIGLHDGAVYPQAECSVTSKNVQLIDDLRLKVDHEGRVIEVIDNTDCSWRYGNEGAGSV